MNLSSLRYLTEIAWLYCRNSSMVMVTFKANSPTILHSVLFATFTHENQRRYSLSIPRFFCQ